MPDTEENQDVYPQQGSQAEGLGALDLGNPDFVRFAGSFGALGLRVSKVEHFKTALEEGLQAARPAVIEPLRPERLRTVRKPLKNKGQTTPTFQFAPGFAPNAAAC